MLHHRFGMSPSGTECLGTAVAGATAFGPLQPRVLLENIPSRLRLCLTRVLADVARKARTKIAMVAHVIPCAAALMGQLFHVSTHIWTSG
jgi:hypothetical protein